MSTRAGQGPDKSQTVGVPPRISACALTVGVLLLLCWTSVLPAAAAIVRQPYLQQTTPTSITIVWQTDLNSANNSRVQFGTTAGILNQTALGAALVPPSNSGVKNHEVSITGLSPAKKYFYNVGTVTNGVQDGGTVNHFFVTAPLVGIATPFRAWIVGDSGNASLDQKAVRDAMLAQSTAPDLFLHMGDIAYVNGTDGEFTSNHFAIYQDILRHTPSWPTLGNHEAVNSPIAGVGPYYEAHVLPTGSSGTEAYYSFDYANAHFIVLDSMTSARGVTGSMLQWLASDLGSTSQEWIIAYFHHPPYTKGTHDSDNSIDSGGRMTDMREIALGVLEAGGVDLVLGGHSHIYERSFLLDQAYGYGPGPNFVTPNFSTLLGDGHLLDVGNGNPSGSGAYKKNSGGNSNRGAVYVVAGHGGRSIGSNFGGNHPVMSSVDVQFGSVLLDVNGATLTVSNLRTSGSISDTFAIQKSQEPLLTTPPPGSTLTASPVLFQWSAGSGVVEYWLQVGTTPTNRKDLYNQSAGTTTSASVSTIPLNGNPAYARLWWRIGTTWASNDYTYQTQSGGGGLPALTTPPPGSTLTASPVLFQWSAGSGVVEYWLQVGTTPTNRKDLYNQSAGTTTSASVSTIPLNGNPAYARLWWRIGTTWASNDYTYQTQSGGGGLPALTTPPPGSTLTASPVLFQWSAGSGVVEYWLQVGTTPTNRKDLYNQSAGTTTSASVSTIPLNGNPAYARLWWRIGTTWASNDYTYQTQSGGGGLPALTTPPPGSTLTASPVLFQWSAGSGVVEYWLQVGTTPTNRKDLYNQSAGTTTSASVSTIPLNGNPAYARLWWRIGTTWASNDYTYQTQAQ